MNPAKKKPAPAPKKPVAKKKAAPPKKAEKPMKKAAAPSAKAAAEKKPEQKKKTDAAKIASIRIRLSAFDHVILDEASTKIIDTAERTGAIIHGPIPLPTKIRKFTVNRSTFVHKDAREQFEMRVHKRLIEIESPTPKVIEALTNLTLPSGVNIDVKMM